MAGVAGEREWREGQGEGEREGKGGRERVSRCFHLILHILPRSTMSCSFGHSRALLRGRRSRREDGRLDRLSMCCSCATSRPGGSMGLADGWFWRVNYVRARKF